MSVLDLQRMPLVDTGGKNKTHPIKAGHGKDHAGPSNFSINLCGT